MTDDKPQGDYPLHGPECPMCAAYSEDSYLDDEQLARRKKPVRCAASVPTW